MRAHGFHSVPPIANHPTDEDLSAGTPAARWMGHRAVVAEDEGTARNWPIRVGYGLNCYNQKGPKLPILNAFRGEMKDS